MIEFGLCSPDCGVKFQRNSPKIPLAIVAILAFSFLGPSTVQDQKNAKQNSDFEPVISNRLTPKDIESGWLSLFDQKTLVGWRPESAANWYIEDGTIICGSGEFGLLRTSVQFDDFELRLKFRAELGTKSGVFIRTSPKPSKPNFDCLKINIAPATDAFPTGSIYGFKKTKLVCKSEEWHGLRIRAVKRDVKIWLDGRLAASHFASENSVKKGFLGLQFETGKIEFKDIFIRPLHVDNYIDGMNLANWRDDQKLESTFSIQDSALRIFGGRGQLETRSTFGDFIFSSHIKTNSEGLNSGVFFRCIPGELMQGYESQIQNSVVGQDASRPLDCGTGGIFRRKNARFVNAIDRSWFAKTIIANGTTFAVWINGSLITDWTDQRPRHSNPRRGSRVRHGSVILQGHDKTTDILFREILIRELKPRR